MSQLNKVTWSALGRRFNLVKPWNMWHMEHSLKLWKLCHHDVPMSIHTILRTILQSYFSFISTHNCQIILNYQNIWLSYAMLIGVTREILPTIVPDGDNSSPNVLHRTGGTKSKSKYAIWIKATPCFVTCKFCTCVIGCSIFIMTTKTVYQWKVTEVTVTSVKLADKLVILQIFVNNEHLVDAATMWKVSHAHKMRMQTLCGQGFGAI